MKKERQKEKRNTLQILDIPSLTILANHSRSGRPLIWPRNLDAKILAAAAHLAGSPPGSGTGAAPTATIDTQLKVPILR